MQRLALATVILLAVCAAGLTKIADLDFWWHLKAGQLIAQTHSIPRTDVFSFTAFGREYVDHEWLFQLIQYGTYAIGGPAGIAILKTLLVALILTVGAFYAIERGADPLLAGGLALLALAGGITRFIERPELFSMLFAVVTFIVCDDCSRTGEWKKLIALPVICAVWANLHAAVIVGLIIQVMFIRAMPQLIAFAASVAASCINPFGHRVLTVPFELTKIIDSGVLNNEEWRHPTLQKAPVYFVALALVVVLLFRRTTPLAHAGVAVFLAYISLKYIRNVGLFSVFVPLLVARPAASLPRVWRNALAACGALVSVFVLTLYFPFERGFGVASYFPDRLAREVRVRNLRGNMMNSYAFGGYLIWTLFPERRVFIDGRNEVFLPLLERLKAARTDSRVWNALLRDEKIEYAVLDYVDDLDRVTTFDAAGKATVGFAPITATRFPRSRWALIDFDDDGMILVKRNGMNRIADEYDAVFPEGRGYQQELVRSGVVDRARAIEQLERKLTQDPTGLRATMLLRSLRRPEARGPRPED